MKDRESKSFAKQIKRYAKVGGVVGALATKLAGQKYLGVKLDKKKTRNRSKKCSWKYQGAFNISKSVSNFSCMFFFI